MKQKTKINLIFAMMIFITLMVCAWIGINYMKNLGLQPTLQDWLVVGTIMGLIFLVIEVVEAILMHMGQRRLTHHFGKTFVESIKHGYDELAKDKEAQVKLQIFMAECGDAFINGVDGSNKADGKLSGRGFKIELPEKMKWAEGMVNQPMVKKKLLGKLEKMLEGGEASVTSSTQQGPPGEFST